MPKLKKFGFELLLNRYCHRKLLERALSKTECLVTDNDSVIWGKLFWAFFLNLEMFFIISSEFLPRQHHFKFLVGTMWYAIRSDRLSTYADIENQVFVSLMSRHNVVITIFNVFGLGLMFYRVSFFFFLSIYFFLRRWMTTISVFKLLCYRFVKLLIFLIWALIAPAS